MHTAHCMKKENAQSAGSLSKNETRERDDGGVRKRRKKKKEQSHKELYVLPVLRALYVRPGLVCAVSAAKCV